MKASGKFFFGLGISVVGLLLSTLGIAYHLPGPLFYEAMFVVFGTMISFYLLIFIGMRRRK